MRYIIIFLIGFFLGGMFGGDLSLLFNKTKDLVFNHKEEKSLPVQQVRTQPKPQPQVVRTTRPAVQQASSRPIRESVKVKKVDDREKVYTIQVASFRRRNQAKQYVNKLLGDEYDAYIAPTEASKPNKWYRVCIGETISLEQAKVMNKGLKSKFKDSFIYSF